MREFLQVQHQRRMHTLQIIEFASQQAMLRRYLKPQPEERLAPFPRIPVEGDNRHLGLAEDAFTQNGIRFRLVRGEYRRGRHWGHPTYAVRKDFDLGTAAPRVRLAGGNYRGTDRSSSVSLAPQHSLYQNSCSTVPMGSKSRRSILGSSRNPYFL